MNLSTIPEFFVIMSILIGPALALSIPLAYLDAPEIAITVAVAMGFACSAVTVIAWAISSMK